MVHPKYEKNRLICVSLDNHEIVEYSWDGGNYPPSQSTNKSLTLGNVEDYYRRSTFYYVSDLHIPPYRFHVAPPSVTVRA